MDENGKADQDGEGDEMQVQKPIPYSFWRIVFIFMFAGFAIGGVFSGLTIMIPSVFFPNGESLLGALSYPFLWVVFWNATNVSNFLGSSFKFPGIRSMTPFFIAKVILINAFTLTLIFLPIGIVFALFKKPRKTSKLS